MLRSNVTSKIGATQVARVAARRAHLAVLTANAKPSLGRIASFGLSRKAVAQAYVFDASKRPRQTLCVFKLER